MIKDLFLVFMSGIFLGPYAFLGIGLLADDLMHMVWYYCAALLGDIYSIMFMYSAGYFFKDKVLKVLLFFKIKQEAFDKALHTVGRKALLPLFLVIPFVSHSVDGAVYLACGILKIQPLRFFYTVLVANLILSIGMIFFAGSIKNVAAQIFSDGNMLHYVLLAIVIVIAAIVFFRKSFADRRS